ncbi:MAG: hypothetical protein R3D32_07805 [Nitratireductor sp.]
MIPIKVFKHASVRKIVSIFLAVVFVLTQISINAAHAQRMAYPVEMAAHHAAVHEGAMNAAHKMAAVVDHDHSSMMHSSTGHVGETGAPFPAQKSAKADCSDACCLAGCGVFAVENSSILYHPRHVAVVEMLPEIARSGLDRIPPNRPPRY